MSYSGINHHTSWTVFVDEPVGSSGGNFVRRDESDMFDRAKCVSDHLALSIHAVKSVKAHRYRTAPGNRKPSCVRGYALSSRRLMLHSAHASLFTCESASQLGALEHPVPAGPAFISHLGSLGSQFLRHAFSSGRSRMRERASVQTVEAGVTEVGIRFHLFRFDDTS